MVNSLVTHSHQGWTDTVPALTPGSHVAVLVDKNADLVGIDGRMAGLELRDTLVVLWPGRTSLIFLFRKPVPVGVTVAAQVLATGSGGINIAACRVEGTEIITTHSRGNTTAFPKRREKTVEEYREKFVIEFFDELGRHSSVEAPTKDEVQALAALGSDLESLLSCSVPFTLPTSHKRQDEFESVERTGRWPANVVLVHSGSCTLETCEPTCPVSILDTQSGVTGGGSPTLNSEVGRTAISTRAHNPRTPNQTGSVCNYGDEGGASRFFPRFKDEAELHGWITRLVTPTG